MALFLETILTTLHGVQPLMFMTTSMERWKFTLNFRAELLPWLLSDRGNA